MKASTPACKARRWSKRANRYTYSEVIGAVGESADSEAALGAHLHFAFFLDGEAVMPPMEEA